MDLKEIGPVIVVLGGAGTLIYGFINNVWPRLLRLGARGWNCYLLQKTPDRIEKSDWMGRYALLESCKEINRRSETHKLQRQRDTALHLMETLRYQLRRHVRFFLTFESVNRERCTSLILAQNAIQPLFQFELGHVRDETSAVESKLRSIGSNLGIGRFIEQCEAVIAENEETGRQPSSPSPIRILVTQAALPKNYYLWGHMEGQAKWHDPPKEQWGRYEPNKFWVISLALLEKTLPGIPVQRFILRVMQRACVLALLPARRQGLADRLSHYSTYGCLFDFTVRLAEAQYYASRGFICEECAGNILQAEEIPFGFRGDFLNSLQTWLVDSGRLNSVSEKSSVT
jgi:hypothetical protein